MDTKQRIEAAKANVKRAENAKTIAETQAATAQQQLEGIVQEMATAGVTPDTISSEILKLEAQINSDLDTVERLTPQV
jgi:DNA-binding transcriptional regulator YhcF (GntR family)